MRIDTCRQTPILAQRASQQRRLKQSVGAESINELGSHELGCSHDQGLLLHATTKSNPRGTATLVSCMLASAGVLRLTAAGDAGSLSSRARDKVPCLDLV